MQPLSYSPGRTAGALVAIVAGILFAGALCGQDAKVPIPPEEDRVRVGKLVQDIYRDEYRAAKTTLQQSEIAQKILSAGSETTDDAAGRYVMLRLARDIAIRAGDADTATEAVDALVTSFHIDEFPLRAQTLIAVTGRLSSTHYGATKDALLELADIAIEMDDYDAAQQIVAAASADAKRARDWDSSSKVDKLANRIAAMQAKFRGIADELKQFQEDATKLSPEAALTVGKFYAFSKNEWQVALGLLVAGNDKQIADAARAERTLQNQIAKQKKMDDATYEACLDVADLWWRCAESLKDSEQIAATLHAGYYYQLALPGIKGLQNAKAESRIRDARAVGEIVSPLKSDDDSVRHTDAQTDFEVVPMANPRGTVNLPATFDDYAMGGNGRYIIFLLGSMKKLAFFDIGKRDVTQYVTIDDSDVRIAGGSKYFYVALRRDNVIQRWNYEEFTKEATAKLPFVQPVDVIATGHAVNGPVFAGAKDGPGMLLNPQTMQPISYMVRDEEYQRGGDIPGAGPDTRVRVSANGRAFSFWGTRNSPGGFRTLYLGDRFGSMYYDHKTMGYIQPNPAGDLMYTALGIFTTQTKAFAHNNELGAKSFFVPAISGDYCISIPRDDDKVRKNVKQTQVHLHVAGSTTPLLTLQDIQIRPGAYGDFHGRELMTLDRRLIFAPKANLIVTLPDSNKSLELHQVDLEKEFDASDVSYLYVASRPPTTLNAGNLYRYQIDVRSRAGDLSYELASGPQGMKVSTKGLITWKSSRRVTGSHDVLVTIKDGDGQECTHAFKVTTE
ncbi:putative Ig domain-containing protein [Aporhodopirellula aestuarii]|uniref:Cadherin repeat domain-containing protein n=1 Tax=Aporhodopirellula aestuarii TaxID=2950107 RepID=A0ABT0U5E3_9BACT|nr:putative Ig domain-containing protein [Aporhodopirellula aestuarii]MCM2372123.1 hypothetical protein [Aporhodopirellula aestuarii]